MTTRWQDADVSRGADYDVRWEEMAAAGDNIHGEADLVQFLLAQTGGHRVLDAGCGTGRVAAELSRRGVSVAAVDADPDMLAAARAKDPELPWAHCDLADESGLARTAPGPFDLILLAGNVMIFLTPGSEQQVLANLARRLAPGGLLVSGFSLDGDSPAGDLTVTRYDALAAAAGLHHAVADGNVGAVRLLMVDLPPARRQAHGGLLQHLLDLGAALDGGHIRPGLARPGGQKFGRQVRPGEHALAQRAVSIDDQRNVGRGRQEKRGLPRIELLQQAGEAGLPIPGMRGHALERHVVVLP